MVTRYEMEKTWDNAYMNEDQYGEWVDYEDYKELQDKYDKLVDIINDLWKEI